MKKNKKDTKLKIFSNSKDSFKISETSVFNMFWDFAILLIVFVSFLLIFVAAFL